MPQLKNICKFVKGFSFKNTKNTENYGNKKTDNPPGKEKKGKRSEQMPHQEDGK